MSVPIRTFTGLEAGQPKPLFAARVADIVPLRSGYTNSYDVSPDGQRFLMITVVDEPFVPPITVIQNWKPPR
jgi:hypothetical protein